MQYESFVFGPVRSGRLGLSLGLDLTGAPVCSMDCVYCEVGATTGLTCERRAYVPADRILGELAAWREAHPQVTLDAVTLGGMGEPTLNTEFGAVIDGAREILPHTPVAVLTNSTSLVDPEVRRALTRADVVLPSLDSLVEAEFQAVNRPAPGVTAGAVAEALLIFREEYAGLLYLEILLVAGVNDSPENLGLLADFVKRLRPERVDVVTISRPGTLQSARGVDAATLARWRERLGQAHREQAVPSPIRAGELTQDEIRAILRDSIRRRPQTRDQLSQALGVASETIDLIIDSLLASGAITPRPGPDGVYYAPVR
jgi:wyosine [tRNA(Phe)-imidazoG37] synthetase (radical SAM superfamily)